MNRKILSITFVTLMFFMLFTIPFVPQGYGAENKELFTLEELLAIAAKKTPSVAIFKANIEAAEGEIISGSARPNPEIDFEVGRGESLDGSESKKEYSVSIGQRIERPKKRLYRKKAAEAAMEAARYDKEVFLLDLRYEVEAAFYHVLLKRKEAEITAENVKAAEEILQAVTIRVEAGESPKFELVKAQVESLKAAKEMRRAERMVAAARTGLNSLLGNALPGGFDVEGGFAAPVGRYKKEELLSNVLEGHPLIERHEKAVEAGGYVIERERFSVAPDFTLKGFYDRELDKESYGVGISFPLPFRYRREGEIIQAQAEKAKAEAELLRVKVELSGAAEEAFRNYDTALDEVEIFEKGLLRQAEEALDIAGTSYKAGETGLLDYLDARRVYRETVLEYNLARFELSLSDALIKKLVGEIKMKENQL